MACWCYLASTEKGEENIRTGFFQESNFYYLTGWQEPGAILLLTPPQDDKPYAVLFLPRRQPDEEKWTGRKAGPDDTNISQLTGFDTVLPVDELRKRVTQATGPLFGHLHRRRAERHQA
jgi:Xaa-Pro aminopeptidase